MNGRARGPGDSMFQTPISSPILNLVVKHLAWYIPASEENSHGVASATVDNLSFPEVRRKGTPGASRGRKAVSLFRSLKEIVRLPK